MKLYTKNKKTGKSETITQDEVTMNYWGVSFFVESELDAFKAAYLYKDSKHGVKVEFAGGAGRWMVTVLSELGAKIAA